MSSKQIELTESLLKRGVESALREMGAGLTDGMSIGGIVGVRPDGSTTLIKSARVTVVGKKPSGIRLAAVNGEQV